MKQKYKFIKRKGLIFLVIAILSSAAFGALTVKQPRITDKDDAAIAGATVQMIIGGDISTPNDANLFIGALHGTQFAPTDANGVANTTILDLPLNTSVYVKAWNTAPLAGNYYGILGPMNTGTAIQMSRWDGVTIKTEFKASAPPKPSITPTGYSLRYVDPNYIPTVSFAIDDHLVNQGAYWNTQLTNNPGFTNRKYRVIVKENGTAGWDAIANPTKIFIVDLNEKSGSTSGDNQFKFKTDGTRYVMIAMDYNSFGASSDPDNATASDPFEIPRIAGPDVGAAETAKEWNFIANADKTHINTFAIPFVIGDKQKAVKSAQGNDLTDQNGRVNIHGLIMEINIAAGEKIVTTFGWWDNENQRHVGLTAIAYENAEDNEVSEINSRASCDLNGDGQINAADVAVFLTSFAVTDRPYQVSVTKPFNFTLRGYKQ